MVEIDNKKCIVCGLCVKICHEYCISVVKKDYINIDYEYCSTCGQCIAICPKQALSWNHVPPQANCNTMLPSDQQINELFKQRHTIRYFKDEKIDRKLIEEIVNFGAYAPTHNFNMRALVIDDEKIISDIDRALFRVTSRIYKLFFRYNWSYYLVKVLAPNQVTEYLRAKPKLQKSMTLGRSYSCPPTAIIFIIGDKRTPLSDLSAQYALYNMNLYAQTKGIGGRNLVGNQMFFNKVKSIRKRLGLKKHERILATLGIGIPAITFSNKVEGKKMEIQWS